jgi:hypothetical protein
MSEDIRKMIDRVKNFKQFVNENNIKITNKKLIDIYGIDNLTRKINDYIDYIKSFSKNNKLKIYRGIYADDVLIGDDAEGFCDSYTINLDVAKGYGDTIISGYIFLNDIDWDWLVERVCQKIEMYLQYGESDINAPFKDIDFEYEINPISNDKVFNTKIIKT